MTTGLDNIRSYLFRYSHLTGIESSAALTAAELHALADEAHANYQAARYQDVVARLPALLAAADFVRWSAGPGDRVQMYAAYASAYGVATKLLTKMGSGDLALLAADRAAGAATETDSTQLRGAAAYHVACALLCSDRNEAAECLAVTMAEQVQRCARGDLPSLLSVAGALWLIAAIVAARRTDRAEALARLDEAERLARLLGKDGNFAWMAFGTTNVAIHRVTVAAELGEPGEVVRAAELVDPDCLPTGLDSRRAQVHLDVAWAQAQRRRDADAVLHLLEAEQVAPEALRYNVMVRELVREMLVRQKRSRTNSLHRLAVRAGVLD